MANEVVAPPGVRERDPLDESLIGLMGTLGKENTSVNYLQVNMPVSDLDKLGLVSEIPGSEKWPIRQLFQRDIDEERVKNEIIPYFLRSSQAKFFNPLTIAVLPISKKGAFKEGLVENELDPSDGYDEAFGVDALYKLSYSSQANVSWGELKWSSKDVRLIAIDGQHRLSALKRIFSMFQQDADKEELISCGFQDWIVPVVLVTLGKYDGVSTAGAMLEKTRSIFVTINKQAKPPSRSRTILLNDFSVTALACQELLDNCEKDGNILPLAVFDWREYRDEDIPDASTFLLSVDELEDLHISYLLGEDIVEHGHLKLSEIQEDSLFWSDMEPRIKDTASEDDIREAFKRRYKETIFPVVVKLLTTCKPYSDYVEFLNELSKNLKHDTEQHAWSRLVYGSDFAVSSIESEIIKEKKKILNSCNTNKDKLGSLFKKTIGVRSIFSAFEHYVNTYTENIKVDAWTNIADKFVVVFNKAFDEEYFSEKWVRHIAFDQEGNVINYKLEQVRSSLGSYIAFVCLSISSDVYDDLSGLEDSVRKTLASGYQKVVRPDIRDNNPTWSIQQINAEVKKQGQNLASKQFNKIAKKLSKSKL